MDKAPSSVADFIMQHQKEIDSGRTTEFSNEQYAKRETDIADRARSLDPKYLSLTILFLTFAPFLLILFILLLPFILIVCIACSNTGSWDHMC